jgi:HD-GYP domain-containing protein (c-di-GMP phosphodiesterase class II)
MNARTSTVADHHIKRIAVDELRIGMYVDDLSCDWLSHPFMRSRFPVKTQAQIAKIRAAGIAFVYIDTSKGDDLATAPTTAQIQARVDADIDAVAQRTAELMKHYNPAAWKHDPLVGDGAPAKAAPEAPSAPPPTPRGAVIEEMTRAKNVYEEATSFVRRTMHGARHGKPVDLEAAREIVERIADSVNRSSSALLSLCKVRDKTKYHYLHSVSVCTTMIAFARALGGSRDKMVELGLGGLVHDVGMAFVPESVRDKPGKLTPEEYALVKRHPESGFILLERVPGMTPAMLRIAIEHHERIDGSGYPYGLAGEEISKEGQMVGICDVYDAITADRIYHKGMPASRALRCLLEWSEKQFDRELVKAFIRCVGVYPAGSLVRLGSERLAIVLEQSPTSLLEPLVRVVYDAKRQHYLPPDDLDLSSRSAGGDVILRYEDPVKFGIDTLRFI